MHFRLLNDLESSCIDIKVKQLYKFIFSR